jgi:hypothetical protein
VVGWNYVSGTVAANRPIVHPPRWYMSKYGASLEWYWQGKTKELGDKTCPFATLSTTILHGQPWAWPKRHCLCMYTLFKASVAFLLPIFPVAGKILCCQCWSVL